jgi:hypothetical protein
VESYRLAVEGVREAGKVWTPEEYGKGTVRRMDARDGQPETLLEAGAFGSDGVQAG